MKSISCFTALLLVTVLLWLPSDAEAGILRRGCAGGRAHAGHLRSRIFHRAPFHAGQGMPTSTKPAAAPTARPIRAASGGCPGGVCPAR